MGVGQGIYNIYSDSWTFNGKLKYGKVEGINKLTFKDGRVL